MIKKSKKKNDENEAQFYYPGKNTGKRGGRNIASLVQDKITTLLCEKNDIGTQISEKSYGPSIAPVAPYIRYPDPDMHKVYP